MEKDFTDEATALAAKMFQALPPGTHSNALILALQSMLGTVIGRTAIDVDNEELYSSIAEDIRNTAVFVRHKHGAFD
jgi:hypothetical protein